MHLLAVAAQRSRFLKKKVPPHRRLLANAERALEKGDYESAVITAQTAYEVFFQRAISVLLVPAGGERLQSAISGMVSSYSPYNGRLTKLYRSLTGDRLDQTPFWAGLLAMCDTRNDVIHRGIAASQEQALQGIEASRSFMIHVEGVLRERAAGPK